MKEFLFLLIFSAVLLQGCFPTFQVNDLKREEINERDTMISAPSKIQLYNDDIYIFPKGFRVKNDSISGMSKTLSFDEEISFGSNLSEKSLHIDSVAAIVNYKETTSGLRYFGSFLFGLTAPAMTALSVYCIACPKCCFGSCPTIYNDDQILEAELFSESISRQLENHDLDILQFKPDKDFSLRITNEALETHYINKFNLFYAVHPTGTKLYPDENDSLILIKNENTFIDAVTKDNSDAGSLLLKDDNFFYRSGAEKINQLKSGLTWDHLDITAVSPAGVNKAKMIIKYRNTLLSTILLYDVVLASQGINAVEWTERMNNDEAYASQFKFIYDSFSGITVKNFKNNNWQKLGKFKDAGPLNWKYAAIEVPVEHNTVNVRLEFIPDNFMIDYVAFDFSNNGIDEINIYELYPLSFMDEARGEESEAYSFVEKDDSTYLVTNPGDSYKLKYSLSEIKNEEATLFIRSKGYYNEWIRGSWIKEKNSRYSFNLYDLEGTLSYLAESWIENKDIIEREFFNAKIQLRGSK